MADDDGLIDSQAILRERAAQRAMASPAPSPTASSSPPAPRMAQSKLAMIVKKINNGIAAATASTAAATAAAEPSNGDEEPTKRVIGGGGSTRKRRSGGSKKKEGINRWVEIEAEESDDDDEDFIAPEGIVKPAKKKKTKFKDKEERDAYERHERDLRNGEFDYAARAAVKRAQLAGSILTRVLEGGGVLDQAGGGGDSSDESSEDESSSSDDGTDSSGDDSKSKKKKKKKKKKDKKKKKKKKKEKKEKKNDEGDEEEEVKKPKRKLRSLASDDDAGEDDDGVTVVGEGKAEAKIAPEPAKPVAAAANGKAKGSKQPDIDTEECQLVLFGDGGGGDKNKVSTAKPSASPASVTATAVVAVDDGECPTLPVEPARPKEPTAPPALEDQDDDIVQMVKSAYQKKHLKWEEEIKKITSDHASRMAAYKKQKQKYEAAEAKKKADAIAAAAAKQEAEEQKKKDDEAKEKRLASIAAAAKRDAEERKKKQAADDGTEAKQKRLELAAEAKRKITEKKKAAVDAPTAAADPPPPPPPRQPPPAPAPSAPPATIVIDLSDHDPSPSPPPPAASSTKKRNRTPKPLELEDGDTGLVMLDSEQLARQSKRLNKRITEIHVFYDGGKLVVNVASNPQSIVDLPTPTLTGAATAAATAAAPTVPVLAGTSSLIQLAPIDSGTSSTHVPPLLSPPVTVASAGSSSSSSSLSSLLAVPKASDPVAPPSIAAAKAAIGSPIRQRAPTATGSRRSPLPLPEMGASSSSSSSSAPPPVEMTDAASLSQLSSALASLLPGSQLAQALGPPAVAPSSSALMPNGSPPSSSSSSSSLSSSSTSSLASLAAMSAPAAVASIVASTQSSLSLSHTDPAPEDAGHHAGWNLLNDLSTDDAPLPPPAPVPAPQSTVTVDPDDEIEIEATREPAPVPAPAPEPKFAVPLPKSIVAETPTADYARALEAETMCMELDGLLEPKAADIGKGTTKATERYLLGMELLETTFGNLDSAQYIPKLQFMYERDNGKSNLSTIWPALFLVNIKCYRDVYQSSYHTMRSRIQSLNPNKLFKQHYHTGTGALVWGKALKGYVIANPNKLPRGDTVLKVLRNIISCIKSQADRAPENMLIQLFTELVYQPDQRSPDFHQLVMALVMLNSISRSLLTTERKGFMMH